MFYFMTYFLGSMSTIQSGVFYGAKYQNEVKEESIQSIQSLFLEILQ